MLQKSLHFDKQNPNNIQFNIGKRFDNLNSLIDDVSCKITGNFNINNSNLRKFSKNKNLTDNQKFKIKTKSDLIKVEKQIIFQSDIVKRSLDTDISKHNLVKRYVRGEIDSTYGYAKKPLKTENKNNLLMKVKTCQSLNQTLDNSGINYDPKNTFFLTKTESNKTDKSNLNNSNFSKINNSSFSPVKKKLTKQSIYPVKSKFPLIITSKTFNNKIQNSEILKRNTFTNSRSILKTESINNYSKISYNNKILITENFVSNFDDEIPNDNFFKTIATINNTETSLLNNFHISSPNHFSTSPDFKRNKKINHKKKMETILNMCKTQIDIDEDLKTNLEKDLANLTYRPQKKNEINFKSFNKYNKKDDNYNNTKLDPLNKYFIYGEDEGFSHRNTEQNYAQNIINFSKIIGKISENNVFKFKNVIENKINLQFSLNQENISIIKNKKEISRKEKIMKKYKRNRLQRQLNDLEKSNKKLINGINNFLHKS